VKGDKTQPTPISEEEYTRFKQWVQDVHGTTRGHLSTEIENALREYRQPDDRPDTLTRIEDELTTIKAYVVDAESDGGVVVPTENTENTRTHAEEKPSANSPRVEKIEWLVSQYPDSGSTTPDEIEERVTKEFGFEERTANEYVQPVINTLKAKRHPNNPDVLVWGSEIEEAKKQAENAVEEEMNEVLSADATQ